MDVEENVTLFKPTKKGMKAEYPELRSDPAYADISNAELKFAWYYANPTSPFNHVGLNISDSDRIQSSLEKAFGTDVKGFLQW